MINAPTPRTSRQNSDVNPSSRSANDTLSAGSQRHDTVTPPSIAPGVTVPSSTATATNPGGQRVPRVPPETAFERRREQGEPAHRGEPGEEDHLARPEIVWRGRRAPAPPPPGRRAGGRPFGAFPPAGLNPRSGCVPHGSFP